MPCFTRMTVISHKIDKAQNKNKFEIENYRKQGYLWI